MALIPATPEWAKGSGYGYGYGYGYGSGSGYGYGYGYGDGYGSGSGSDGYGYGYGSGFGDGSGSGSYWAACVGSFALKWDDAQRTRLAALKADGARIAYWRSTEKGTPANGGRSADPVAPGTIHVEPGPLRDYCGAGQLHATLIPPKWKGERWWIVALIGEVRGDDEKLWALKREIIGECL